MSILRVTELSFPVRVKDDRYEVKGDCGATTLSIMTFGIITFSITINKSRHSA
jgi:hypothetical protein